MTKKYILVMDGENLAATLDGPETDKKLRGLVSTFHLMGLTIKEVTEDEYAYAIKENEHKELNNVLGNIR